MKKITSRQFRTVLLIELALLSIIGITGYTFWNLACSGSIQSCVAEKTIRGLYFSYWPCCTLFASPIMVTAMIAGGNFGPIEGTILASLGTAFFLPIGLLSRSLYWTPPCPPLAFLKSTEYLVFNSDLKILN